jgi:hypothetical protein
MNKDLITAARLSMRRHAYRHYLAFFVTLSALFIGIQFCRGQNLPLSDLVPLQDLEVRTNELIQIATAYADGQRDLIIAQLNLETLCAMSSSTVVSQLEIRIAKLNVAAAERKVAVFRAIAEKQLAATQVKLEILEQMERIGEKGEKTSAGGSPSQNRVRIDQARAIVSILQMILEPLPSR